MAAPLVRLKKNTLISGDISAERCEYDVYGTSEAAYTATVSSMGLLADGERAFSVNMTNIIKGCTH